MHIVTAYIQLGGDAGSVVYRGEDNPLSWPEIGVLQFLHGEESVFDIKAVREIPRHRNAEKERLKKIYGDQVVELVYPGRSPMIDMNMPAEGSEEAEQELESQAQFEDPDDLSGAEADANFEALTAKNRAPRGRKGVRGVLVKGDKRIPLGLSEDSVP